jgi:hypothetical protein
VPCCCGAIRPTLKLVGIGKRRLEAAIEFVVGEWLRSYPRLLEEMKHLVS